MSYFLIHKIILIAMNIYVHTVKFWIKIASNKTLLGTYFFIENNTTGIGLWTGLVVGH